MHGSKHQCCIASIVARRGILLLIAALIWGSSFIVMKSAVDFLTPAVLLFFRFSLAAILLSLIFIKKIRTLNFQQIKGGLLTGCCLFAAYYVQTWGLNYTTPGKNAFLTAVYCAIVPFLVWLFYHKRPDIYNFIAAFICVLGIGCVSLDEHLTMNIGDFLTLCGGFLYACHILLIKKFSKGIDGGAFTSLQFMGGAMVSFVFLDIFFSSQIHIRLENLDNSFGVILIDCCLATFCQFVKALNATQTCKCNRHSNTSLEAD